MSRKMRHRKNFEASAKIQKIIRDSFMEYFSKTTIHGIPYLMERKRHWTEKCWWTVAICLSIWFCGSFISNIWIKWRNDPVKMTVTEEQLPISTIPFPTVTVCPEIKTHKSKLDIQSSPWSKSNLSENESARLESFTHLCKFVYPYKNVNESFANTSIFYWLEEMAPTVGETFQWCNWAWKTGGCSNLFVPIITEEGLCFTFNALNSNEIYTETMAPDMMKVVDRPLSTNWSLENGYKNFSDANSYPNRVYSVRYYGPLYFYLNSNDEDVEYVCGSYTPGYRIYLHTPGDILKSSDMGIRVPFAENVEISIKPKLITTASGLRNYKPSERKCYFNQERQLKFFKFYSEENCRAECLANYTLQTCGCVKFSMPRHNKASICGYPKFDCLRNAFSQLVEGSEDPDKIQDANSFLKRCDCLPSCTSITYEAEVDRVTYDLTHYYKTAKKSPPPDNVQQTRLLLFFQSNIITTMRREEQYTNTDFLAICGGIFGLCLGISVLSIIEFIYYSTLRLFWTLRNRKSENKVVPFKPQKINYIFIH